MERKGELLTGLTLTAALLSGCSPAAETQAPIEAAENIVEDDSNVTVISAPEVVTAENPDTTEELPQIGDYEAAPLGNTTINFDTKSVESLPIGDALLTYLRSEERKNVLNNVLDNVGPRLINLMQAGYFGVSDVSVQGGRSQRAALHGPIEGWAQIEHDADVNGPNYDIDSSSDNIQVVIWQNEDGTFDLDKGILYIMVWDNDLPESDGLEYRELTIGGPLGDGRNILFGGEPYDGDFNETSLRFRPLPDGYSTSNSYSSMYYLIQEDTAPTLDHVMAVDQQVIDHLLAYVSQNEQRYHEWQKELKEQG